MRRVILCVALLVVFSFSYSQAAGNFKSYKIKTGEGFVNAKLNVTPIYAGCTFFVRDDYRAVDSASEFNDLVADKLISRDDGQTSFNYRYCWLTYKGINNKSLVITVEGNLYSPSGDVSNIPPETLTFPENSKYITIGYPDLNNKPMKFKVVQSKNEFLRVAFVEE